MDIESSRVVERATRAAALRLRGLLDEVRMLVGSFPDLQDAFDADELPVSFILQRDSRHSEDPRRRHGAPFPAMNVMSRRPDPYRRQRRAGYRKRACHE